MCVTMIDPATSWFDIVKLRIAQLSECDIPMGTQGPKGLNTHKQKKEPYFDKTSATVGSLINRTWFCHEPHSQYIVYDNRSEFKCHLETLCDSYGLKHKLNSVKNQQSNAIHACVHQTIMGMLHTAEVEMLTESVKVT